MAWLAMYWWIFPAILLAAVAAAVALIVPLHAYRRGHGFVSWFVLQFVAMNPVYPLILVAILPNKARMRLRTEYDRDLNERLRRAGNSPVASASSRAYDDASVGDRPTEGTAGQSIGDVPTRE